MMWAKCGHRPPVFTKPPALIAHTILSVATDLLFAAVEFHYVFIDEAPLAIFLINFVNMAIMAPTFANIGDLPKLFAGCCNWTFTTFLMLSSFINIWFGSTVLHYMACLSLNAGPWFDACGLILFFLGFKPTSSFRARPPCRIGSHFEPVSKENSERTLTESLLSLA
mmetsp:Transcript_100261/g.174727  ORF Transcript_100261/g.174727 Transcript_100261/m.174727 type:complete len:167 (-) Transcript_100261:14-514(-)